MRPSTLETRNNFARARRLALLVIAAGLLSGCETTGPGPAAPVSYTHLTLPTIYSV